MIKNPDNFLSEPHSLRDSILSELVGSQSSQFAIDELGVSLATHVGFKRARNEDRISVAQILAANAETYTLAIICDGVGGSESGDQAAALAIASIIANLAQQRSSVSLNELAVNVVKEADAVVRKELRGRGATTLVMLLAMSNGNLVCVSVGDSRAYSWDPNANALYQVSVDDTIENVLKDLPDNGASLIKARGLQGYLSQALGEVGRSVDDLRLQVYTKEHFPFGAVIGSDGLWRVARDFEAVVANSVTPIEAVRRAITHANLVGGVDNSSMVAISKTELFCGRNSPTSRSNHQTEVVLWLPFAKIKFRTNYQHERIEPAAQHNVIDRPKQKSKRKGSQQQKDALQLEIESIDASRLRPQIEVTVDEEPKKGK